MCSCNFSYLAEVFWLAKVFWLARDWDNGHILRIHFIQFVWAQRRKAARKKINYEHHLAMWACGVFGKARNDDIFMRSSRTSIIFCKESNFDLEVDSLLFSFILCLLTSRLMFYSSWMYVVQIDFNKEDYSCMLRFVRDSSTICTQVLMHFLNIFKKKKTNKFFT